MRLRTDHAAPPSSPETFSLRATWAAIALWSLLIGAAAVVNLENHAFEASQHARAVAEAYIDKDLAVRRWITEHGGVYVPPTERTPPNPYLDVPDRDVVTTSGKRLTLVNPAYATRQLQEDFAAQHGIASHLTGLVLKNPKNAPLPWERTALERLAAGAREIVEQTTEEDHAVLRLMRPVYMEQGCLKCHADMDIPVGGLRGGISATLPMEPFLLEHREGLSRAMLSHFGLWLVGLVAIGFTSRRYRERFVERAAALRTAQRDDRRIAEILSMSERLEALSERDIVQEGLEAAVRLTDSRIGYLHFVNEDQNTIELVTWSRDTLKNYCKAAYDTHYPIERAGVWADCARLHQPVVHNDYPGLAVKRGLPEGHAHLQRLMSVPVIESGRVRLIAGVGNKEVNYDEGDVRLLQLLANDVWKLVQRKRADTDLRESEQRLREAEAVAQMGSFSYDHGDSTFRWSDEMYRLCGVARGEFTPTMDALRAMLHPEDRAGAAETLVQALAEGRTLDRVARIRRPDGATRILHLRAVTRLSVDGKPTLTYGMAHDVTERDEVARLRQTKAELTTLFEHTDRLIWLIDAECRLVLGNPPFHQMMERLLGTPVRPGDPLPPPDVDAARAGRWRELYAQALRGEQVTAELQIPERDGGVRWLTVHLHPIVDEVTGRVSGVSISGRDATERHRAAEAQHQSLHQMESMVRQLEGHHQRALQVQRLNDLLQSCRSEGEAHDVVALIAPDLLPGVSGALSLARPGHGDLAVVAAFGPGSAVSEGEFGVDDCWALRRGEPHMAQREADLRCRHVLRPQTHPALCLALVVRGETLGHLALCFPPDLPAQTLMELQDAAKAMAGTIKLGLSNLRLRVALEDQAVHDALTGLFNRRYLDLTLPRELHRAERAGGRLCVAMLDIDHFKRFNDTMGHEAGDLVLRTLGSLLRARLRRSDIGCRYGGEELLLILPDSELAGAEERLAALCAEIRSLRLEHMGRPLPPITVSVGLTSTTHAGYDCASLVRRADEALYAAKGAGRDRIVVFRGD